MKPYVFPLTISLALHGTLLGVGASFYQSAQYAVQQAPSSLEVSFSLESVRAVEEEAVGSRQKAVGREKKDVILRSEALRQAQDGERSRTTTKNLPVGKLEESPGVPIGRSFEVAQDDSSAQPHPRNKQPKSINSFSSNPSIGALSETPPGLVFNLPPIYPRQAREQGIEGRVVLRVEVLADGRAGRVEVERSSAHAMLDESAVKAVRKWQFSPAKRLGHPVVSALQIPVIFELDRKKGRA